MSELHSCQSCREVGIALFVLHRFTNRVTSPFEIFCSCDTPPGIDNVLKPPTQEIAVAATREMVNFRIVPKLLKARPES